MAEPPVAEEPTATVEPTESTAAPAAAPATQRPRRAKAAPAVLFQPPEPDRPLPRRPRRTPADLAGDASAEQPDPVNGDEPGPAADVAPTAPEARTTPARKAAPRKATGTPAEVTSPTPAPRKRAASPTKRAATPRKSTTPAKLTPEPAAEQQTTPPAQQTAPATEPAARQAELKEPTARQTAPAGPTEQTKAEPAVQQTAPAAQAAARQVEPALGRTPESELRAVAARVLDHPGFAPELLALAAVRALGPGAAGWAAGLRTRYPDASADGLARLAARRFVRASGAGGATAALAGFFAPLAELAAVLWTHSALVLHLAAAYGKDPTHPDRAVDLLVLTQVHPDRASAAAALAAAETAGDPVEGAWPRAGEAAWRLAAPLTAQAGGWVALRLVARLLPGAAVLAAALGDSAAADRLAARAVAGYRPERR
ncbi:hypothetical protein AB0C15_04670 [Micromonospora sp. NPDC048835]|uniref:hypothetical protein n=1 Tax=Micromonospora sp. NPDC048835 TaxID=3155147 RepID=UPI003408B3D2